MSPRNFAFSDFLITVPFMNRDITLTGSRFSKNSIIVAFVGEKRNPLNFAHCAILLIIIIIIIIIIILLKQDYKVQLANNKIQMAWLTCWLVVG